jgi:hypothetical protein
MTSSTNNQKNLDAIIAHDPFKGLRSSMESIALSDPLRNFRKTIESIALNDPLKDFRKTIESIALSDPLKNFRRTVESIALNDPLKDFRKTIESIALSDPLKDFRKTIESIALSDPLKDFRKTVESIALSDPLRTFREIIESAAFSNSILGIQNSIKKYQKTTDVYKNIFHSSTPVNTFDQAFNEVFSNYIKEIILSENDHDRASLEVAKQVNNKANSFSVSSLSIDFYLNVLVSLIFLLYSLHLSQQSEEKIAGLIMQTQEVVIERFNQIAPKTTIDTYYIVVRSVNLRLKPSKKSTILNVIYPNQKVRLVKRKGKWIQVEYYNHLLDIHENGWCYKKYLNILNK